MKSVCYIESSAKQCSSGFAGLHVSIYVQVTNTVFRDVTATLLVVLPLPAKHLPAKFSPVQLAYHRLRVKHLTDISIKLADFNRKNIDFDENKTIVLLELHFPRLPL